ncbi:capsular biosynthesis protein, partial [Vibrio anguillarum]|nr:capsular biosynthesis protein [Vibrio anguillarum]
EFASMSLEEIHQLFAKEKSCS